MSNNDRYETVREMDMHARIKELERQNAGLRQQLAASADRTAATVQPVAPSEKEIPQKGVCISPLATRPILYTDTINGGQQVLRDDLWAVTTAELNALHLDAAPQPQAAQSEDSRDAAIGRFLMALARQNSESSWPRLHKIEWCGYAVTNEGEGYRNWTLREALEVALAQAGKEQSNG